MPSTNRIFAEFSYKLRKSTKCTMSGILINKYRDQVDKLVKQNCSKMMNDDSYEAFIYNENLFNNTE